jgi:hypothetical protein
MVKHNPVIRILGVWWLIETDKAGNEWAVNGPVRLPYGQGFARKMIDEAHAVGVK